MRQRKRFDVKCSIEMMSELIAQPRASSINALTVLHSEAASALMTSVALTH